MNKLTEESGKEMLISMQGTLALLAIGAFDEEEGCLKRKMLFSKVCKSLSLRRYGAGASEIFKKVEKMTNPQKIDWVESVWDKYIKQNDIMNLLSKGEI